jgi:hypothetical protein
MQSQGSLLTPKLQLSLLLSLIISLLFSMYIKSGYEKRHANYTLLYQALARGTGTKQVTNKTKRT